MDVDQHIEDVKILLKYIKHEEYEDEVSRIIREVLVLRCTDGKMRSTYTARVYLPITPGGMNIEAYYRNIGQNVFFVDMDFYRLHDIETQRLVELGVRSSLLTGDYTCGTYETGFPGRSPEWWTAGEFRWKLSADALKDVLKYISAHRCRASMWS